MADVLAKPARCAGQAALWDFLKNSFKIGQRMEEKALEADMLKSSLPAMFGDFMGGISGGKLIRDQEFGGALSPC